MMLDGHNRIPNMRVPVPDLEKAAKTYQRFQEQARDGHEARRWILFWSRGEALNAQLERNHLELAVRLSRLGIEERALQILFLQCLSDAHLLFALCPMEDIQPRAKAEAALAALLQLRLDAKNFFPSHPSEGLGEPFQSAYETAFAALASAFARNPELFRREFEVFVRKRFQRPLFGEALLAFLRSQIPQGG